MTDERLAEYASLFSEPLDDKTPMWLLGWAEVAKKGGHELLAEVRRLQKLEKAVRIARRVQATPLNPIWHEVDALLAEEAPQ